MSDILEELRVRPVINGVGNLTILGGDTIDQRVWDDMARVKDIFVDMEELHRNAGRVIADLTGAEDAAVTSGAFAGLVLSFAACMAAGSPAGIEQLPDTEGMKREVVVQAPQRNPYDYCIEIARGKILEAGSTTVVGGGGGGVVNRAALDAAISDERTAAVAYFALDPLDGVLPLAEVIELAHRKGIPVVVDAAAEVPPVENLRKFVGMGADLTVFSAGKDIGAPNDTGIVCGKKKWVEAVRALSAHHYVWAKDGGSFRVFLGRGFKTSKEDVVGVTSALKRYVHIDHDARIREFEQRVDGMVQRLAAIPGIGARRVRASFGHSRPLSVPRVEIDLSELGVSAGEIRERLLGGDPRIRLYEVKGLLCISPQCLRKDEDAIVVQKLREILIR